MSADKQIFGWTAPTPKGGEAGYVMLFSYPGTPGIYTLTTRRHGDAMGDAGVVASTPIDLDGLRQMQHAISLELAAVGGSASAEIHPAPVEFTEAELQQNPILRYFHYSHLPPHLQERSRPFAQLARAALSNSTGKDNAELAEGLRKLLEAKDCIVRAAL